MITIETTTLPEYRLLSVWDAKQGNTFISQDRKVLLFVMESGRVMRTMVGVDGSPRYSSIGETGGYWKPVDVAISIRG